jgi:tryptophanyl-tRNA synthetase
MADEERIDPWGTAQISDYEHLISQFGIERFDAEGLPNPQRMFRRGVIFGHRGFEYVRRAVIDRKPFAILSGLMPSGLMHMGNKMVFDQALYFQELGADVFLLVADIEAFGTRGSSFDKSRDIAINSYILNYIAMGLNPERCQIYFQSRRSAVKDLAYTLSRRVNWSTMRAIYGFGETTNLTHVFAPLVQVGDILHVQLEKYGGPRPTLVPVGVDQDPHMRLTRDIASAHRFFNVGLTKDGKIGAFVKVDENVESLIDEAQAALEPLGIGPFKKIPKYKALYTEGATTDNLMDMDMALIEIEKSKSPYIFYPPASTYHRFMTGLTGGKMSSSIPPSCIFLNDTPEDAAKKIDGSKTGGGVSLEEHREKGGNPDVCAVYELFVYHLVDDDKELGRIYTCCRSGEQACGQCKKLAKELLKQFLVDLAEKRESVRHRLDEFLVED